MTNHIAPRTSNELAALLDAPAPKQIGRKANPIQSVDISPAIIAFDNCDCPADRMFRVRQLRRNDHIIPVDEYIDACGQVSMDSEISIGDTDYDAFQAFNNDDDNSWR